MVSFSRSKVPAVGVEEEYQLVDPTSGRLIPKCSEVLRQLGREPDADIQRELHLNQIEMASNVCETLDEVRENLQKVRKLLIDAAASTGAALVSAGTNPFPLPESETLTPKFRYQSMGQQFQHIARSLFIFGCHVHVDMQDKTLGLHVMNQTRRWLPLLQALTANSPFWNGQDTGYASYRREVWVQWPMAGAPPHFQDLADYEACLSELTRSGAIKDESFIYWDIRLSVKVPTIEYRCADVITSLQHCVGYVGLIRALVMQTCDDIHAGREYPPIRSHLLSFAIWHAARYGVSADLLDPLTCEKVTATESATRLLEYIAPALATSGDRECVEAFVQNVVRDGCGADRQRMTMQTEGNLAAVVQEAIKETANDTSPATC
ncbi:Carboxylate-amine ligase YbdK [Rosistilla carotiformis]|uniref:Putative glutamate--cysteine ligase 2 n=1 Tax=Rosistilla carotiformis TaxID=2528017 RepID=A0A518K061_9BACT|nr:glutamate--cysteine ligase [Rosistilla carotiformis]QDV71191.1 Carboxylate-amine ligase YbdK [Rosistilla carotiformis]